MARQKAKVAVKAAREIKVIRAHQFEDGNISFDMAIGDITIYNCMFITRKEDGKSFIGFPSHKGKDGTYYNYVFTKITDAELEAIDKQLDEIL